jgi:hypothetical protein
MSFKEVPLFVHFFHKHTQLYTGSLVTMHHNVVTLPQTSVDDPDSKGDLVGTSAHAETPARNEMPVTTKQLRRFSIAFATTMFGVCLLAW